MTIRKSLVARMFAVLVCILLMSARQANAATLTVDDDQVQCPNAQYSSIQAAITAANPGDKINVCPGTYHEQVMITKRLAIQGIEVTNQNLAVIMPSPAVANSTSLATANPIAAIVLVDGTNDVTLTNLTVDGATNGVNACSPTLIGIYYRNASGTINSVAVRNIELGSSLFGCQSGLGVFAQSGAGGKSKVDILNSSVHDYQKNGITANEIGTEVNVKGNAVSGIGSTPAIAQNGIQVAFGAKGTIESNAVINHIYAACTSTSNCSAASSNILIVDSDGVKITKNTTGNAQLNIYYQGNNGAVISNVIFQSRVFDGIDLIGDANRANGNTIFNSDEAGVFVMGNNNQVNNGNTINETPVGILEDSSSSGSQFGGNHFFNTGVNTDPAPVGTTAISPAQP